MSVTVQWASVKVFMKQEKTVRIRGRRILWRWKSEFEEVLAVFEEVGSEFEEVLAVFEEVGSEFEEVASVFAEVVYDWKLEEAIRTCGHGGDINSPRG